MVAVVSGSMLGLTRSSAAIVGSGGILGSSGLGRAPQGVTVNAASGNLVIQTQDEVLTGVGLDAVFASSYNSLGAANGSYTNLDGSLDADGWLQNTQRKIVLSGTANTVGSTATLTDWDGTQVVYTYNSANGQYQSSEAPFHDDFLKLNGMVITYIDYNSLTIQYFNTAYGGRIMEMRDIDGSKDGNRVTFTYDQASTTGKLIRVTTANSSAAQSSYVDFVYGANSLTLVTSYHDLATSTNKALSRVVYTYDTANRLSTVTTDLTPLNGGDAVNYVIAYTYKDSTSKLITGITQSDGTSLTIAYDALNRVASVTQAMESGVSQTTAFTYDVGNRITTITDALSNQYKMGYDTAGRLIRLEEPASVTGGNATVKTFAYDAAGNATEALTFDNPANVGNSTLAVEATRSRYDSKGFLIERAFGDGSAVAYTRGSLGEITGETRYTGLDANSLADAVAPAGAMTTRYVYDNGANNGVADDGTTYSGTNASDAYEVHVRFAISAEGRVTECRYNAAGQLIATIRYAGSAYTGTVWTEAALASWVAGTDKTQVERTDNVYDIRGALIQTTSYSATDSTGAGLTTANWSRAEYTYDQAGRMLSRRVSGTNDLGGEAVPVTEFFVYDGLGRIISTTDTLGQTTTISIDDGARTTTITTPNAATQTQIFKISGAIESASASASGTATATSLYAYDALGRLRMATDASGLKTYYVYDRQNRLTATIDDNGTLREVKYDGANRVVASVTYANAVSAAGMTALGTVATNTEVATIRPAVSAADRWQWTIYDKAGKVLQTIDAAGAVVKYDYDGAGRMLATTAYFNVINSSTINGVNGISGFRTSAPTSVVSLAANVWADRVNQNLYNNDGLLVGTVLQLAGSASGRVVEYGYDRAGRLVETIQYGNTIAAASWQGKSLSQIKTALVLDSAKDSRSYRLYDGRGRLGATIDGEGNATRYHYTAAGNIDQEIRGQQVSASTVYTLATLPAASGTLETTRFYYNAAGLVTSQVRTLAGGTETTSYAYDNRGRLLSQTTSETVSSEARTQTMRYDAKGRLTGQLSGMGSAALAALGASPAQNLIDTVYATHGTQYVYDFADRLIQTITPDGSDTAGIKTLYYYDADGQLRFTINALGEVSEHRYNVLEDRTETIVFGTRLSSGTVATLSGGLVTATITNAVLPVVQGGIGDATKDSRMQATFDNRGLVSSSIDALGNATTFRYNPFGQTATATGPVLAGPNAARIDTTGYYTDGQLWYSDCSVNANAAATLSHGYTYDGLGRLQAHSQNSYDQRVERWWYDRAGRNTVSRDNYYNATISTFDPRSNLISSTDRTNKTTTFAYDLFNRTVTTTSAEGIVSSVKRNAYGQTILIADGKGQTTSYSYDKNGNLKTVTDAAGTTTSDYDNAGRVIDATDANGVKTRYSYDAVGRVLTKVRDHGAGKLNLTTAYAYDAKGQTISVTDALGVVTTYGYDLKGQKVTAVQDAGVGKSNLTTQYSYRADGKVVAQIEAFGTAQARTTQFEYDTYGRLTKTVADAGSGNNALGIAYANAATFYFYDVNNNQIAQTDALGRTTRYIYDADNRLTLTIDAEGEVAQTIYDAEDRAIATRRFVSILTGAQLAAMADKAMPDQWNELTTATNGDITITKKVKDLVSGVVTATIAGTLAANAGDRITRSFYDRDGRAVYGVDGEGYVTQNVYDKVDNVIQTIRYALQTSLTNTSTTTNVVALFTTTQVNGGLATGIPTDSVVTTYSYDGANRLTDVTDAEGVITHFVLDALGQISETHVAYDTGDVSVTKNTYDAVGRITSETRAFGASEAATTQYVYDALGQVVKTIDPRGNASFFYYDNLGRMNWSVDAEGFVTKTEYLNGTANTKVTRYAAKASNAATLTPATLPSVTADAARDAVSYAWYDGQDRLVWNVDAEGYVVKSTYLIGGVTASATRYANKAGNLASLALGTTPTVTTSSADATSTFTYDLVDRVKTATDAEGNVESYVYDALGNRTSFTNKLGGITNYAYDKRGLIIWERPDQTVYDASGNVVASNARTDYLYDARANLITKIVASNTVNPLTTSFVYDKLDRVIRQTDPAVTNPDAADTVTPISEWAYDKRGNVVQQKVQQKVELDATTWASTTSWYDKLGRKAAEVSPVGTFSQWTYDAGGNLLTQKVWSTGVAVPTTPGGVVPSGSGVVRETRLAYDKNGRLIESKVIGVRTGAFNGTSYVTNAAQDLVSNNEYDAYGNLVKEIDANRNAIFHWYDKNGRELAKLDQESFLTTWSRDADGNVTAETRFTTRYNGALVAGGTPPSVAAAGDDRTTEFTYDKMGRRLSEKRLAVLASAVSGGSLTTTSQTATIGYTYNAMGEVTSKTESTGDRIDYQYDQFGRLERQLDAVQADFNSSGTATVRHASYFFYDGANNLVRTLERAEAGTAVVNAALTPTAPGGLAAGYSAADDRATRFIYSGGKLVQQIDALNFARSYTYDTAGRRTLDSYTRTKSDGTTVTEGNFVSYDAAGRATAQWQGTKVAAVWTPTWPQTLLAYNAYGEVTARAIKASASDPAPLLQEQMVYDNAGRVVKTNSGDGVWKVLVYDANGNATLTLTALTRDMAGDSVDTALTAFGAADSSTNTTMAATIAAYDKRNMALSTREPQRQIDGTATRYTIARSRTYTAFGEVASETDARGYNTDYSYNTMGRMTRTTAPTVQIVNEDGTSQWVRPASDYFYDAAGRLVATRDAGGTYAAGGTSTAGTSKAANTGNLTTRILLAGTGYGGTEAKLAKETRADGSVWESRYDAFGQLRVQVDGNNSAKLAAAQAYLATQYQYDKSGHVTAEVKPSGLTENYVYDELGQRTKHWNSYLGALVVEKTDYDSQGRVSSTVDYMGHRTNYAYAWSNTAHSQGLASTGSWIKTTTYVDAANRSMSEGTDEFGRVTTRSDLSGNLTSFSYDKGGRLIGQTSTLGQSLSYAYYNTGKIQTIVDGAQQSASYYTANVTSNFTYDVAGNRLTSSYVAASYYNYYYYYGGSGSTTYTSTLENATASYDAMNRITNITDAGDAANKRPSFNLTRTYDANSNVRSAITQHQSIDSAQNLVTTVTTDSYWYRYDSLNRLATSKGSLSGAAGAVGTTIVRGLSGSDVAYDASGQRVIMWRTGTGGFVDTYYVGYGFLTRNVNYTSTLREDYEYGADGYLTVVRIAGELSHVDENSYSPSTFTGTNPTGAGSIGVSDTRDAMGRTTDHIEYKSDGITIAFRRQSTYNNASQILTENTSGTTGSSTTTYNYGINGSTYANGAVVSQGGTNTTTTGTTSSFTLTNSFLWRDRALQGSISNAQSGVTTTSSFTYNANNFLTYVATTGAQAKQISYTTDAVGQIMVRTQTTNGSTASPKDYSFFFNGVKIGAIGNNGTDNVDYAQAIKWNGTTDGSGPFREGAAAGSSFADFDQNWSAINPAAGLEGADSSYTVQAGQTLSSIAAALWGDASLWYLLAQANGLTSDDSVTAGQTLTVPAKVLGSHNSAATFKPYDAAKAVGDVAPGAPKPPKGNKCGVIGMILLAVVAIAVTAIVGPQAIALAGKLGLGAVGAGFVGGAVTGAIASAASQGVGVLTGIQDKFDWKAVGLAALAGGVGGGLGGLRNVAKLGKVGQFLTGEGFTSGVVRQVTVNAATQGLNLATGLQDKFSWSSVAGSALSAGIGRSGLGTGFNTGATLIVGAAARSVIDGTDFGDNVLAALPDAIGGLIYSAARSAVTAKGQPEGAVKSSAVGSVASAVNGLAASAQAAIAESVRPSAAVQALMDRDVPQPPSVLASGALDGVVGRLPDNGVVGTRQSASPQNFRTAGASSSNPAAGKRLFGMTVPVQLDGDGFAHIEAYDYDIKGGKLERDRESTGYYTVQSNGISGPRRLVMPMVASDDGMVSARFVDFDSGEDLGSMSNGATSAQLKHGLSVTYKAYDRGEDIVVSGLNIKNCPTSFDKLPSFVLGTMALSPERFDPRCVPYIIESELQAKTQKVSDFLDTPTGISIPNKRFAEARWIGEFATGGPGVAGLDHFITNKYFPDSLKGDYDVTVGDVLAAVPLPIGRVSAGVSFASKLIGGGKSIVKSGSRFLSTTKGLAGAFRAPATAKVEAQVLKAEVLAAKGAVPSQLARGRADEATWLAENGLTKNNQVWRPTAADIDSATFKAIVGDAKYTPGGKPVGTIFDVTKGGFTEYKSGSSMLDSSYQLRLQTYCSVTTETPFSIVTTRLANPRFQQSLDFWGVNVVPPK